MWRILVLSGSLELYECCYHKSNSTFDFCFRLSCLCDGNSEIPEWIHSFKFLNLDVNFLLRMRIFHCPLSVFFFLFDHQSMSGSFVVRSASYGSFSTNQVDIIYEVKIIDLLSPADNFVLPEFSSLTFYIQGKYEQEKPLSFSQFSYRIIYLMCTLWRLYFSNCFQSF